MRRIFQNFLSVRCGSSSDSTTEQMLVGTALEQERIQHKDYYRKARVKQEDAQAGYTIPGYFRPQK